MVISRPRFRVFTKQGADSNFRLPGGRQFISKYEDQALALSLTLTPTSSCLLGGEGIAPTLTIIHDHNTITNPSHNQGWASLFFA